MAEAHLGMRREEIRDIKILPPLKGESEKILYVLIHPTLMLSSVGILAIFMTCLRCG